MLNLISVDPGRLGCFVRFENYKPMQYMLMPLEKSGEIDCRKIYEYLSFFPGAQVVLEKVRGIRGASCKSTFNFGVNYGTVKAIVKALSMPLTLVEPKVWQAVSHQGIDKRIPPKLRSFLACENLFPEFDLNTGIRKVILNDNIADSLLIGHWFISTRTSIQ